MHAGDASLPAGWQKSTLSPVHGLTRQLFSAPDGTILHSRDEVKLFLSKSGRHLASITGYDEEELVAGGNCGQYCGGSCSNFVLDSALYSMNDKNRERKSVQLKYWPTSTTLGGGGDNSGAEAVVMLEDRLARLRPPRRLSRALTYGQPLVSTERSRILLLEDDEEEEMSQGEQKGDDNEERSTGEERADSYKVVVSSKNKETLTAEGPSRELLANKKPTQNDGKHAVADGREGEEPEPAGLSCLTRSENTRVNRLGLLGFELLQKDQQRERKRSNAATENETAAVWAGRGANSHRSTCKRRRRMASSPAESLLVGTVL